MRLRRIRFGPNAWTSPKRTNAGNRLQFWFFRERQYYDRWLETYRTVLVDAVVQDGWLQRSCHASRPVQHQAAGSRPVRHLDRRLPASIGWAVERPPSTYLLWYLTCYGSNLQSYRGFHRGSNEYGAWTTVVMVQQYCCQRTRQEPADVAT